MEYSGRDDCYSNVASSKPWFEINTMVNVIFKNFFSRKFSSDRECYDSLWHQGFGSRRPVCYMSFYLQENKIFAFVSASAGQKIDLNADQFHGCS